MYIVGNSVANSTFFFSENIAKLGVHTKLVQCDGTFRTAPSTTTGHFYQNLMLHAKYEGHVMPFFKVIMTGKSGALYRAVFEKIKEELPDSVNPETVMCDFEPALQNGLQEIFPEATVTGCWFHFSQVGKLYSFVDNSVVNSIKYIFSASSSIQYTLA